MADSIETIKASLTAPDHKIVNGERVDLSDSEANSILDKWAENERDRQLDAEANGYKTDRQSAYPPIEEQLDKLYHDINNGTLDTTGEFFTALNTVKTDNPKPSE